MFKRYLILTLVLPLAASQTLRAQQQIAAAAEPVVAKAVPVSAAPAPAASPVPLSPGGLAVALRNGDSVDLRIANVPPEDQSQWDGSYTVDESGMINLPFIGLIKAGGMPPSQVQLLIQNKLIQDGIYTNPTISVNPPVGMRFISVGGAVRGPGRIPYTPDLTLMSAINAAGGASDFAGDKVRLTRGGTVKFFSRKKLYKHPADDPRIDPGDQIEILESWW